MINVKITKSFKTEQTDTVVFDSGLELIFFFNNQHPFQCFQLNQKVIFWSIQSLVSNTHLCVHEFLNSHFSKLQTLLKRVMSLF